MTTIVILMCSVSFVVLIFAISRGSIINIDLTEIFFFILLFYMGYQLHCINMDIHVVKSSLLLEVNE